jgi:nicotinamide-nucleotide amidase
MPQTVLDMLIERGGTLTLAESCTGGMLAAQLVDCPGASNALLMSYVTYSNESKIKALGVSNDTIARHGAVSAECAREMAEGARARSGADYALSVTGIAGPDGGTDEKPVGTVYAGLAGEFKTIVTRYNLRGDRARIRSLSCLNALDFLRRKLLS